MSRQLGGSIEQTGSAVRSTRPAELCAPILYAAPSGGRHASSSLDHSPVAMSCSRSSTAVSTDLSPELPRVAT